VRIFPQHTHKKYGGKNVGSCVFLISVLCWSHMYICGKVFFPPHSLPCCAVSRKNRKKRSGYVVCECLFLNRIFTYSLCLCLSLCLSFPLIPSLSHTLSLSHTYTHAHARRYAHTTQAHTHSTSTQRHTRRSRWCECVNTRTHYNKSPVN